MMAESIVCALFWYGLVGWCTAELHRRSGFTHVTAVPDTGSVGPLCSCAGLLRFLYMSIISVAQVKGATMMTKQRLIQLIHIARNDLQMDEDTYRQMLQGLTGKASTKGMDTHS